MGEIRVKIPQSALDEESKRLLKKVKSLERKLERLERERAAVKADKARVDNAIGWLEHLLSELRAEFGDPWEYLQ